MSAKKRLETLYWDNGKLYLLDQRFLPHKAEYRVCETCGEVVASIREMTVRGAPAIGITAAFGMAIAAREALEKGYSQGQLHDYLNRAAEELIQSRPTAVNLAWAVTEAGKWLEKNKDSAPGEIISGLENLSLRILAEDIENNRLIGLHGAELVPEKASILTHCNAGAFATGGYGTALGVIRAAVDQGKKIHVYVDETRPLLQGARITAFELLQEGIAATLITDNCAGHLMSRGKIDLVVVGADRIAGNGDTANKIGTYTLAVLAGYHNIPFYVAAPLSTIDAAIAGGEEIVIEERCQSEITHIDSYRIAPEGIDAFNPAFDITPAGLITAIITERGVVKAPDKRKLLQLFANEQL